MEVRVDTTLCEANGVCAGLAPAVFSLDADELLHITPPEPDQVERVSQAVARCPKGALSIVAD